MSSYVNKKGEKVEVSEEHLKTAVKIKLELQKASPSRKCQWSLLVKLMKKEGFDDAEASEPYRCLIKKYQKSIGELPEVTKYAEMVSEGKLESIKELVGEIAYEKRNNQLVLNELNKAKREIIDYSLVAEQIGLAFKNFNINTVNKQKIVENSEREMIVCPADWHVGFLDDLYNHKEAIHRIDLYLNKIIEFAKIFNINKFHFIHLGDIIESLYLHNNTQSFNAEFTNAEQIVKATELVFYMINTLSEIGNVYFKGVVRGNHGRMSKKGETVLTDCVEYIVHEQIKSLIKLTKNERIIIDDEGYNIERSLFEVKGKNILGLHGEYEGQNDREKIQKQISLENKLIDLLILGHFHNYQVKTENHGRKVYGSGCLQGETGYGRTLKYSTTASQGIIIIGDGREIIPIDIPLE